AVVAVGTMAASVLLLVLAIAVGLPVAWVLIEGSEGNWGFYLLTVLAGLVLLAVGMAMFLSLRWTYRGFGPTPHPPADRTR
ncbi:MAG: hypothetical protein WCP68_22855, partial [Enhydrobacter sp.]